MSRMSQNKKTDNNIQFPLIYKYFGGKKEREHKQKEEENENKRRNEHLEENEEEKEEGNDEGETEKEHNEISKQKTNESPKINGTKTLYYQEEEEQPEVKTK